MKLASTIMAILQRSWRNPALLGEVWQKTLARFTLPLHQKRTAGLGQQAVPFLDGLSSLPAREAETIQSYLEAESLATLLAQLEAYQAEADLGGAAYLQVCYALVRLARPQVAVETGVAHGYSSAVILQALADNNQSGHLYSIDLPPFRPGVTPFVGGAVPDRLRAQWELILGPDRQMLPPLLERLPPVDFFHYDSDKSYEGMLHTLKRAWPYLRPGAWLMMDDIHSNDAFLDFAETVSLPPVILAKPTRQGVYRWEKNYYVGLLRKPE